MLEEVVFAFLGKSQKSFLCAQWSQWSPWTIYRAFLSRFYLERTSCQGTWANAIIIQAVANCLYLSIIAESNPTFFSSYCCWTSDCYNCPKPLQKQKAKNAQHIRKINKQSIRKRQRAAVLASVFANNMQPSWVAAIRKQIWYNCNLRVW